MIAAIVGLFLVVNIVGLIEIRRAVTQRSHVTIESVEPEGRVNAHASVSIRFSEPMVLATALGKDVSFKTALVAFEPGIAGVFRWKNPRTLCFFADKSDSPQDGLEEREHRVVVEHDLCGQRTSRGPFVDEVRIRDRLVVPE